MTNPSDELYLAAKRLIEERFGPDEPWMGAAAVKTDQGNILTSTGFQSVANESARLCHETGTICECFKLNEKIVQVLCISRNDKGEYDVIPPCGICQERLMYWGDRISVAVPIMGNTTSWEYLELKELQPYHWVSFYRDLLR